MYTSDEDIFKTYTITFVRDKEFIEVLNFNNLNLEDLTIDIGFSDRILVFESYIQRMMFVSFLNLQMFRTDSYKLN